jgi:hypothetical protein
MLKLESCAVEWCGVLRILETQVSKFSLIPDIQTKAVRSFPYLIGMLVEDFKIGHDWAFRNYDLTMSERKAVSV